MSFCKQALPLARHVLVALDQSLGSASMHRRAYAQDASPAAAIQWVFLGAPGVGKGTYASRAAKHFNVAHIATGDLIRNEIKEGSPLGQQVGCEAFLGL